MNVGAYPPCPLVYICKAKRPKKHVASPPPFQAKSQDFYAERLLCALAFIESHLEQPIQLKDLADAASLSAYHFHRVFRLQMGETVKAYIERLRLSRARQQLRFSQQSVADIATGSGYMNPETFARAFQRNFDQTASNFRQQSQHALAGQRAVLLQRYSHLQALGVSPPRIVQQPSLHLAFVRHIGAYDQVEASFKRLILWAVKHLALRMMPTTLGILHDEPDLTAPEQLRFDACVVLSKALRPRGEIGYRAIPAGKYAVFRYQGDYPNFYDVYDYIYCVCLQAQGWQLANRPPLEWYVRAPPFYKPHQYLTDFYLPIE